MKECIRIYFLHGSIFCLGIYMSLIKPSIWFWKWVISIKWRNKLLIYNINLTGHRKSACCLRFVFLEVWVIAPFWHWRTQVFPKGCCHHDLKSCERALKSRRVKSEIVRKSSFGDIIFLTSHDYIWLLFISFLYCAKEGLVEISKVA